MCAHVCVCENARVWTWIGGGGAGEGLSSFAALHL